MSEPTYRRRSSRRATAKRRRPDLRILGVFAALAVAFAGTVAAQWTEPPPIVDDTLVFFSPHPDDESYAAAQTLAANVRAGKRVVVVLMADGEGSKDVGWWLETMPEDFDGDGDTDKWDFGLGRRAEFTAALAQLGVTETVFLGAAESQGATGVHDKSLAAINVPALISSVATDYPGATLATVMKWLPGDTYLGDESEHVDHTALCDAVHGYAKAYRRESYFLKPYIHMVDTAWYKRLAPHYIEGDSEIRAARVAAIDEYAVVGRRSWNKLFDAARASDVEYMVQGEDF